MKQNKKEPNHLNYNKFIFLDQDALDKVQPLLIKLLKLTAPPEFKIEKKHHLLTEFVTVVQSTPVNWMRPAKVTRIELLRDKRFDKIDTHIIFKYFEQLGLFDHQTSHEKNYDAAVILGTSIYLKERFFELQDLSKKGVIFNKIFLLGSLDDISWCKHFLEVQIKENVNRFKHDIKIPDILTQHDAMLFFMENLLLPNDIQEKIISLPVKIIQPNTHDELIALVACIDKFIIKNSSRPKLAIFSNPPFCFRQNLIFQQMSKEYEIITLAGGNKPTHIAIILDELSRLCYQLNEFIKEKLP